MASLASRYWGNHLSACFYHEHCQGHYYHHQYLNDDDREDEFGFWYLQDYLGESGWGMYWKWHKGGQSWGISELNQSLDYILLKWSWIIIIIISISWPSLSLMTTVWKTAPRQAFKNTCCQMCVTKVIVLTWLFIEMMLHDDLRLHDATWCDNMTWE